MSYTHIYVSRRQTYTAVVQSNNNIIIYLLKRARQAIKCDFYPDHGFIALKVSCSTLEEGVYKYFMPKCREIIILCVGSTWKFIGRYVTGEYNVIFQAPLKKNRKLLFYSLMNILKYLFWTHKCTIYFKQPSNWLFKLQSVYVEFTFNVCKLCVLYDWSLQHFVKKKNEEFKDLNA